LKTRTLCVGVSINITLRLCQDRVEKNSGHYEERRNGRVPGTRELVIPKTPYIVPYRVRHSTIEIARVYHACGCSKLRTAEKSW
jgi:plasmid stabilization system protein ParE